MGDSSGEAAYTFRCPECDETLEVNAPMKEALVEKGCVVCGATLTRAAFSRSADTS